MPGKGGGKANALPSRPAAPAGPILFPSFSLDRGAIVLPSEDPEGPSRPLLDPAGKKVEVFDAVDFLLSKYGRIYVVDLEGVKYDRPQFEYLQELVHGQEMWVDAGARNAEEVMDVIVAGAERAVLSTRSLVELREVSRSLKLTSQVVLEVVTSEGRIVSKSEELENASVVELVQEARERGVEEIIYAPQEPVQDWSLVAQLAAGGPTYVGGAFVEGQADRLADAKARGGIFPAQGALHQWMTSSS